MKKVFIPKGEVACYDSLYTGRLIVKGVLLVKGKIQAKEIIGGGVVEAGEIVCDDIRLDTVTAGFICARRVAVNRLFVNGECWATECVAVTDFAGAGYLSTGKFTVGLSDIRAVDADEVVMLPQKKRGLLGLLWASWWRSLYMSIFYGGDADGEANKPEPTQAAEENAEEKPDSGEEKTAA